MLRPYSLVTLALIVLVSYGTGVASKPIRPTESSEGLTVGETKRVCGNVQVQVNTIQDSRCPANVMCFWAGQVNVQVVLSNEADSSIVDLVVGANSQNTAQVTLGSAVYGVTLADVTPYPGTNGGAKKADVRVTCP